MYVLLCLNERWNLQNWSEHKRVGVKLDFMIYDLIEWLWEYPEHSDIRRIAGSIEDMSYESEFYPFCICHKSKCYMKFDLVT